MARKLRVEFAGACYHLISRGNYRDWIFETDGARKSFLTCLVEVCESKGWVMHAWCLMGNHYHLLVETPQGNLVDGMRWFQSTFSNRFNRFRNEKGHVFQGRYKALLVDEEARIAVSHYIHLNPVRAGLVAPGSLEHYKHSSFHQLWYPRKRWAFGNYSTCLELKTPLKDSPAGRRMYRDYLQWLDSAPAEQKDLGFERMTRGWIKGSREFKKQTLTRIGLEKLDRCTESVCVELKEVFWHDALIACLGGLSKSESEISSSLKGEPWKIAIAMYLRESFQTPHTWIAQNLKMGSEASVQSWVSRSRRDGSSQAHVLLKELKNQGILD